jgi:hypothetical protein
MIRGRLVNEALSGAFDEFWGAVDVRREVLSLTALRSTIRTVRHERLSNAHAVLARQLGSGLRPYEPIRHAPDAVALGVVVESYGDTAVLLDGTNRAVAAQSHGCAEITVTVVFPRQPKPPAADVVPLGEVGIWAEDGPRPELFRNLDRGLFRPMPEILARAEREVLEKLTEEERNGAEGLHVGRARLLGAFDPAAP